jgi:hypothetical protein
MIIELLVVIILVTPLQALSVPLIAPSVIGTHVHRYATFQSHNQKIVKNANGIFMVYVSYGTPGTFFPLHYRLRRSVDDGVHWITVFEETCDTLPPAIETDAHNNIYLVRSNNPTDTNGYLYRFLAADNYASHTTLILPNGGGQKFSLLLDETRQQLYYAVAGFEQAPWRMRFFTISTSSLAITSSRIITTRGVSADAHYPLMSLDEGNLYFAWTCVRPGEMTYWSIHFVLSKDGAQTWQKADGTPISIPVIADESGPTDTLTPAPDPKFSRWASSIIVKNGKLFMFYRDSGQVDPKPMVQHMIRFDLATARIDLDTSPWIADGVSLQNADGFFASAAGQPLFAATASIDKRLTVVKSLDNGLTWHIVAQSNSYPGILYSISGCRKITTDGYLTAHFTHNIYIKDSMGSNTISFFKVKVQ